MRFFINLIFEFGISLVSIVLLVRSFAFYRARPSNWSFNVQGHRWAERKSKDLIYDRVVYDIFTNASCDRSCLISGVKTDITSKL